jgi:hypothetical protein
MDRRDFGIHWVFDGSRGYRPNRADLSKKESAQRITSDSEANRTWLPNQIVAEWN